MFIGDLPMSSSPAAFLVTIFSPSLKTIACGGVVVNPGDFIVADLMGVVVVPQEIAEETVRLAQEQADREEETRKWVAKGKTVEDLLNEFGRI